jgi:hypothetical protein
MKSRRVIVGAMACVFTLAVACAYLLGRARAAGAPTMQPLTYSGVLTDMSGTPLAGTKNIQVTLWDMAAAGNQVCSAGPVAVALTSGVFQVVLPPQCTTAVHANGDLWVEVFVDGTSLGRTKLGAVPYAIEADHAVSADQASAGFQVPGTLSANKVQVAGDLSVGGILIRKIARAHGLGPEDATDNGVIATRTLSFTKTQDTTGIRVGYADNLRVATTGACQWEIRFNGTSCAMPGALIYDLYYGGVTGMNHHRGEAVFGTCFGLPAGNYTIQIYVGPVAAAAGQPLGDCDTGWFNQYWAIEAEEVF